MGSFTRRSRRGFGLPLALALGVSALATATLPAPASAQSASIMQLSTGRGRLITLSRPMSDVFVANPDIADVQVRSPTLLYVFGKKSGETTISATSRTGVVVWGSTVRIGNNFESVQQMLNLAMPDSAIRATPLNGLVLLTGTVKGPEDAAEAEKLVQAYVGADTKVLSRLRTATPLQVNLQVRFAEVSRTFLKNIGSNLSTIDGTGGFKFGVASGRSPATTFTTNNGLPLGVGAGAVTGYAVDPTAITYLANGQIDPTSIKLVQTPGTNVTRGADRTTLGGLTKLFGLNLLAAIDLGETTGQVTTLANPNLTALSGETGTFLAGGEVPIPVAQALGTISIEYKQYGVSLAYTPTVLADGRISLRVRPEVSQLDYSNAVTLNTTRVPGLVTRRAETTLELGSGQSMMIGGLLQNTHNNGFEKTPGIGDVPVLGALFRSNAYQRNETELVIIITPYLVKPVNNASDIALPTDGYQAPTDLQRVLLGQLESGKSGAKRPVPVMEVRPPVAPALGASAAVPPAPVPTGAGVVTAPASTPRDAADRRKKSDGKDVPTPGFSN